MPVKIDVLNQFTIVINWLQFNLIFLLLFTTYVISGLNTRIWVLRRYSISLYTSIRGLWSDEMEKLST